MSQPDYARRVAARFAGAAAAYDAHSAVQRHAARRLAGFIATAGLPPRARVLEIGCGTGHLSERLITHLPGAHLIVTDIAPTMVAACRARLGQNGQYHFAAMNGLQPAVAGPFDLVCANLAAQWFADLPGALTTLARLLAPGGLLALSLLGTQTFKEWRDVHTQFGLLPGTLPLPTPQQCRAAFPASGHLRLDSECRLDHPSSALDFLRALRAIGADTPVPGHMPLSACDLRRVLRALGDSPAMTYELLYARWQRRA